MVKLDRPSSAEPGEIWLAVETATPVGSVALWRDGLALELSVRIQGTHSERLLPAIDYALRTTGIAADRVTSFIVGAGPGSFTGVRIGAALAKGWVAARGTPLYAYCSLQGLAAATGVRGPVCAMFDARRGEVYAACYEVSDTGIDELLTPAAWPVETLLNELATRDLTPAFAGAGAGVYREAIRDSRPSGRILAEHVALPRASGLLWLRGTIPDQGRVPAPDAWEPLYAREWKVPDEETAE